MESSISGSDKVIVQTERLCICRGADRIGSVPVIGNLLGVIRVVAALAVAILDLIGMLFILLAGLCAYKSDSARDWINDNLLNPCGYITIRSADEIRKGITELFGQRISNAMGITQNQIASGQYIYWDRGMSALHYSGEQLDEQAATQILRPKLQRQE